MSLNDKRQWFLHDMDDYHSGKNGYYEDDVKEAVANTLKDNQRHCDKHDEGYEEFERGYKIAINHCRLNILNHFGEELTTCPEPIKNNTQQDISRGRGENLTKNYEAASEKKPSPHGIPAGTSKGCGFCIGNYKMGSIYCGDTEELTGSQHLCPECSQNHEETNK